MTASRLAIIDYGMGNLHSVASAVRLVKPEVEVVISGDASVIESADHIIFPGVGAIRDCMAEIKRLNVDTMVKQALGQSKPVLSICVGMQALMDRSEENNGVDCLSILPGTVRRFPVIKIDDEGQKLKVPHMGWNQVRQTAEHPLWHKIEQDSRFYFVHSYFVRAANSSHQAGICEYSCEFTAALFDQSLFAVQFHPEKSHNAGLQLLKNFVNWNGKL